MKTAAKVFIIISMVCGFWMILPLIFGGIALSQMSTQKPSTGICVCVLLFCSLIGGILLLCSKEEDYMAPAPVGQPPYQQPYQQPPYQQPPYQQPPYQQPQAPYQQQPPYQQPQAPYQQPQNPNQPQ